MDLKLFKQVLTASCYEESAWRLVDTYAKGLTAGKDKKRSLERWFGSRVARFFWKRGYGIVKINSFDIETRETGNDWPLFGYTMVGHKRLDNVRYCVETALKDGVEGDIVETGVWRGGSMMFAKAVLKHHGDSKKKIWCADSFEGLPKQFGRDIEIAADPELSGSTYLAVSQQEVAANFKRFGLLDENVKFLKGWFKDTLPTAPIDKICVARLDGDLFESTMDALQYLYPKISSGGFVIIDDYGSWKGCSTAVDEYRERHKIDAPLEKIDLHGYFWRVP